MNEMLNYMINDTEISLLEVAVVELGTLQGTSPGRSCSTLYTSASQWRCAFDFGGRASLYGAQGALGVCLIYIYVSISIFIRIYIYIFFFFPPLFGLDLLLFDLIRKMLCHGLNQFNPTFAGALCRFASAALSLPLWRCARVQPASSMFELLQYVGNGGNGEWMFWCFYVCHFSWERNAKGISIHALHICRHRRSLSPWLQRQLMLPQAEMQIHRLRLRLWRLWRLNVDCGVYKNFENSDFLQEHRNSFKRPLTLVQIQKPWQGFPASQTKGRCLKFQRFPKIQESWVHVFLRLLSSAISVLKIAFHSNVDITVTEANNIPYCFSAPSPWFGRSAELCRVPCFDSFCEG